MARRSEAAADDARLPSMADVAAAAGVSHMTVSRVINETGPVRADTRQRVLAAIGQLGYRPNVMARALVTGRSGTLGVVTLDSALYGPASTLYSLENAARDAGFAVSIRSVSKPDKISIPEAVETLRAQAVEGIIVIAPHTPAVAALQHTAHSVPLVAVGAQPGPTPVPMVSVDQGAGARLATEHLLSLGHPTVWHVAGPRDWVEANERERGWRATLRAAGADVPRIVRGDWSPRSGYQAGRVLAARDDVSAVFVANDQMALGVLRAFVEAGISVPRDVRVIGFDDIPEAAYFSPPLSTIRQDFGEVGRRAFGTLAAHMAGHSDVLPEPVAPELILRDSTT